MPVTLRLSLNHVRGLQYHAGPDNGMCGANVKGQQWDGPQLLNVSHVLPSLRSLLSGETGS